MEYNLTVVLSSVHCSLSEVCLVYRLGSVATEVVSHCRLLDLFPDKTGTYEVLCT